MNYQEIADQIFKAYDIRGLVPTQLNTRNCFYLGLAFSKLIASGKIGVCHDMRKDSELFAKAFIAGIAAVGREAVYFGKLTTDAGYFAMNHNKLSAVVVITASHNPGQYNGMKFYRQEQAEVVAITADSGLQQLKKYFLEVSKENKFDSKLISKNKLQINDILDSYFNYITSFAKLTKPLNIAIDFGNGMAGIFASRIKKIKQLTTTLLYQELDGSFPNHLANPMLPETLVDLQRTVKSDKLDLGFAFDGDGDRLGVVDDQGNILDGNTIGCILADYYLTKYPKSKIILSISSSRDLELVAKKHSSKVIYSKQGRFVAEKMREEGAVLGLEPSCHYYLIDNFGLDSGLVAAFIVLNILANSSLKLSETVKQYQHHYRSGEINFVTDQADLIILATKKYFQKNNATQAKINHLDGLRIDLDDSWFGIRKSNTEPLLRLNIEAASIKKLQKLQSELLNLLESKGATIANP